ncbi:Mitochondrial substrate carrier family protein [Perilla frutescens var. hirtella]|uniref:Mitochondrial substrate carrier family protein n=1 Tax=Perilla frutescens var. hirtella TaxID=608512 RepID=A0AAD4ILM6_PERFH|nr:Mitochondrial substrate carrier family protein [Perilla frutescens var. hirtella]
MTGGRVTPRTENFSVKSKSNPFHGASFEIADFDYSTPVNDKCNISNCVPQSSERVSTSDLISAVSYAWGFARKPLSVLLSKSSATSKSEVIQEGGILHYSTDEGTSCISTSACDQPSSCYYLSCEAKSTELVEENQEYYRLNQKAYCPQSNYETSSFWRMVLARSTVIEGSSMEDCLLRTGIPSNFGSIYRWMSKIDLDLPKNLVNSVELESKRTTDYYDGDCSTSSGSGCVIADKSSSIQSLATGISASNPEVLEPSDLSSSGSDCVITDKSSLFQSLTTGISASKPEILEPLDLSSKKPANFDLKPSSTTCSENVDDVLPIEVTGCKISTSRCVAHSQDTKLASHSYDCENSMKESRKGTYEHQKDQGVTFVKANSFEADISLLGKRKPQYALAKQEHAFAGAMAGIFVSLCLHPVDTVKTIIQSCHTSQKPLHYIGRSIIAERGVSGLYRGISSNIVCSAPISALYTFTYESVKKSLLPLLPKEYHSLAHCTAGGCASIATSFLFTPSERIKQQMQVSSHYRNCWTALIQVLQKGGLPSLYAGWGAVLCRNVPHSVIKFYTYESLKQIMLPSIQWNGQANILTTLVCGGLAGSTASLFTTPFDVVKTRLQTQIPGSMTKHGGVLSTLNEIWKHEGLNGVYRGLTPRLMMYMIQGALFFASYESFKRLFALEFPRLSAQTSQLEHKNEDDSKMLPTAVSVTA